MAYSMKGFILTVTFIVTAQAGPITKEYTEHADKGGFISSSDHPKHNSSPWLPEPTESIVNVNNKHGNHYKLTTGPGQSSVALVEYGPKGVSSVITSGSSKPILVEPGYSYHLVDTSSDAGGLKEPEVFLSAKTPQDTAFKSHDVPNKMQNTDDGINLQRNSFPKPWNNLLQSSVLSFPFQKIQEFKPLLKSPNSDTYDRPEKDVEPMISIMSSVDKSGIKTISRNGRGTLHLHHLTDKKYDEDDHPLPIHTWKGDILEEDTYPKNHKEGHHGVETKCCFPHGPNGEISREEFNNDFIIKYGGHHIGSSGSVKKSDYFPYDPKKEINIFIDKFIDDSRFKNNHGGNHEDFYEDDKRHDYSFDKSKKEPKKKFDECEDFKTKDDDYHFGSDKSYDPKEKINKAIKKSKEDECCQIKYEEHHPDPYEQGEKFDYSHDNPKKETHKCIKKCNVCQCCKMEKEKDFDSSDEYDKKCDCFPRESKKDIHIAIKECREPYNKIPLFSSWGGAGIEKEVIISDNVAYHDGCTFIHHMNNRNLATPNNGITNELHGIYANSPSKYVIHDPIFDRKDKEDHKYVPVPQGKRLPPGENCNAPPKLLPFPTNCFHYPFPKVVGHNSPYKGIDVNSPNFPGLFWKPWSDLIDPSFNWHLYN